MKKVLILTTFLFVLFCFAGIGTYKIFNDAKVNNEIQEPLITETKLSPRKTTTENPEEFTNEQIREKERIARIREIKYDLNLPSKTSQDTVIDVMHKMTHQKVRAEKKFGAIPLSDETVNQVYEIVINSNFVLKDDLLAILSQWKIGNYSNIDLDHNYFWEYQDGEIGKAYGKLGLAEEEKFIKKNFQ